MVEMGIVIIPHDIRDLSCFWAGVLFVGTAFICIGNAPLSVVIKDKVESGSLCSDHLSSLLLQHRL